MLVGSFMGNLQGAVELYWSSVILENHDDIDDHGDDDYSDDDHEDEEEEKYCDIQ